MLRDLTGFDLPDKTSDILEVHRPGIGVVGLLLSIAALYGESTPDNLPIQPVPDSRVTLN